MLSPEADRLKLGEYFRITTKTEVWNSITQPWETIKNVLMNIEKAAFDDNVASSEERLRMIFGLENTTVIFLRNAARELIGYTCAYPLSEYGIQSKDTAYIESTAIRPEYQGFRLVGKLMHSLETELKRKGFSYIERDSLIDNGYADSISRSSVYHGKVLESYDWFNTYIQRRQRHFKIKL